MLDDSILKTSVSKTLNNSSKFSKVKVQLDVQDALRQVHDQMKMIPILNSKRNLDQNDCLDILIKKEDKKPPP